MKLLKEDELNKLNLPLKLNIFYFVIISCLIFFGCKNKTLVKPAAKLRLDYPKQHYHLMESDCSFSFQINDLAIPEVKQNCDINIYYPKMKATIYLTYQKVDDNLDNMLRDAQKLAYDHTIKANSIPEQPFVNPDDDVYGMFYMINGDAATQAGFYVTDSINHFLNGALYFEAKPNFDSIYPAVIYLREDIRRLIETVNWK